MSDPFNWNEFWQDRWQKGMTGFHQSDVERLLKKHLPPVQSGLEILVPLCGKSKDLLFFAERGHKVVGVELSKIACESFFRENDLPFTVLSVEEFILYQGDKIKIYCGDFFNFRPEFLQNLGLIYDRAALIALPKDLRLRYSEHLIQLVQHQANSKTSLFLVAISYDQSLKKGPPFSVPEDEIHALYQDHFKVHFLASEPARLGELEVNENAYWLEVF